MKREALAVAVLTVGLAVGLAYAASSDLLRALSADGVFRQVSPLPEGRLQRGERGYDLLPDQFGGHWSVVLGGPAAAQATQSQASSVQFTYQGAGDALEKNGPTVSKLLGRMVGRAAVNCFSLGAERLPELKSWVESSLRASGSKTLERNFGALKVQVLVNAQPGASQPGVGAGQGHAEVDVLMRRSGMPGTSGWTGTCLK